MRIINILSLLTILFSIGCKGIQDEKVQTLFNGKDFSGWDTYVGPSFDTIQGKRDSISPGLNNDPLKVFSVVEEDGEPALKISGERFGGLSTQQEFENYHLTLEFKWGKEKWAPRKNQKRDSGILYHAVGPHGADFGFWMRSQEFQVQEGDCGDYWGVAGGVFDIPATEIDSGVYKYEKSGRPYVFSEGSSSGRHCIKNPDAENASGQWNVLEVYCFQDTSVHVVNGKVVMVLFRSRQVDGDKESPLTKGKIQLQSEGAEVFYRRISLDTIERIPVEILDKK